MNLEFRNRLLSAALFLALPACNASKQDFDTPAAAQNDVQAISRQDR